jgi:hypothetical protein
MLIYDERQQLRFIYQFVVCDTVIVGIPTQ